MGDGNLHDGHRQRMYKKYIKNGIKSLEDHEQLEILLYSIFTRCNTNEISHRLISRFGSIEKVFDANIDELKTVEGIGETAAIKINFFSEFFRLLSTKHPSNLSLSSSKKIVEYCCTLYSMPTSKEIIYALYLDSNLNLMSQSEVGRGKTDFANLDLKLLVKGIFLSECINVVLVHNHPSEKNFFSDSDIITTRELFSYLQKLRVTLIDHIIVCGNTGHSLRSMELMKDIWN